MREGRQAAGREALLFLKKRSKKTFSPPLVLGTGYCQKAPGRGLGKIISIGLREHDSIVVSVMNMSLSMML